MIRALLTLVASLLRSALALFRSREDQALVELAPRQQLAVYAQQLRGAFPDLPSRRYLIFDSDSTRSPEAARSIPSFGIHPRRTAPRSPWQNGTTGRFVGSVRGELLNRVVVLGEEHLRRLLREYVECYNTERVHTSIGDAPEGRLIQTRRSGHARVIGLPRAGGLHHRYVWTQAA